MLEIHDDYNDDPTPKNLDLGWAQLYAHGLWAYLRENTEINTTEMDLNLFYGPETEHYLNLGFVLEHNGVASELVSMTDVID